MVTDLVWMAVWMAVFKGVATGICDNLAMSLFCANSHNRAHWQLRYSAAHCQMRAEKP